jgi:hypothetical protein
MSDSLLRAQLLAPGTDSILVRATIDGTLLANAFATFWEYEGHKVGWITQLCVAREFRRKRLATKVRLKSNFLLALIDFRRSCCICARMRMTAVLEFSPLILLLFVLLSELLGEAFRRWT